MKVIYPQKVNLFAKKTRPSLKPGAYVTNLEEIFSKIRVYSSLKQTRKQPYDLFGEQEKLLSKLGPRITCSSWPEGTWPWKIQARGRGGAREREREL